MSGRARALNAIDLLLLLLGIFATAFAVVSYPGAFGADAHAVYLPIARGLLDGHGLHAFAPAVGFVALPFGLLLAADPREGWSASVLVVAAGLSAGAKRRYSVDRPELRTEFGPFIFDRFEGRDDSALEPDLMLPLQEELLSRRWKKRLRWLRSRARKSEYLPLSPGRYRLRLRMASRGNVAGRVDLGIGFRFQSFFGANGKRHERIVQIARRQRVLLRFCPISAHKSGEIEMEMQLYPLASAAGGEPATDP